MAGSPTCSILIYILWQLTGSTASGSVKELVGSIDGAVTFPLKSEVKQIDSIVWTFNTTPLVTIQPEGGPMIVTQNRNKERVDFPDGGYSLKLSKLKKNDSGIYNVEIYSSSLQDPFTRKYVLRVYESIEEKKRADICRETPNICPYSGENTEYDTIPSTNRTIPMEDAANTLYSTVEIPKKMENPHSLLTMPDTPRLFAYENVI
ncbi:PREDICTED: SLAM family member 7 isoform X6 [Colobus angolensis palliatus]|uniref:Immunoglobulin V-set domain-containing protein n=1 Tax=Colobus angolensis palliatus TaxID=336983 RepID=A0A2K5IPN0_COLAP|nr:PREDICTED: SLAM family member 7 isoform X6 [Colobus angolensis palliatus]